MSAPAVELPTRGSYSVVPTRSTARFSVRGLLGLTTVHGQIPVRSGKLQLTGGKVRAWAELDPGGICTGIRRRDADLRSATFLDVARFPALRFEGTGDLAAMRGWLTARGNTVSATLAIQRVDQRPLRIDVVASTRLDRMAFGITAMRGLMGRYLDVELTVSLLAEER